MKKIKKVVSGVFLGAILVVGSVLSGAMPASAVVWNCSTGFGSVGVYGVCASGERPGDTYRVKILCKNWITQSSYTKAGNWVTLSSGQPSTISGCGAFEAYYGSPWVSTS